jgi:hypothetical protein
MADTRMLPKNTGRSTGIGPTRTVVPSSAGAGTNGVTTSPSALAANRVIPPSRRQDATVEIIQRPSPQAPQTIAQGGITRSVTIISGPGIAPGQGQIADQLTQVKYSIPDDQFQLVIALLERYATQADDQQAQLARSAAVNLEKILVGQPLIQRPIGPATQIAQAQATQVAQSAPPIVDDVSRIQATTTTTILSGPNAGNVVNAIPAAPPQAQPTTAPIAQSIEDQQRDFMANLSAQIGAPVIGPTASSVSTQNQG